MTRLETTVNQLIFAAIYFRVFVFMDIFATIYFRGVQNWTLQLQCTVCTVYIDIFAAIYFRGVQNWTLQLQCTVCTVYIDIFAAIYFCEFFFLAKVARIKCS